jgi:hypothetical protein
MHAGQITLGNTLCWTLLLMASQNVFPQCQNQFKVVLLSIVVMFENVNVVIVVNTPRFVPHCQTCQHCHI